MSAKARRTATPTLVPVGVACVEDFHLLGHELRLGMLTDGLHHVWPVTVDRQWHGTVRMTVEPNRRAEGSTEEKGGSDHDDYLHRLLSFYGRTRNTTEERRGEGFAPHQFKLAQPISASFEKGQWTEPPNDDEQRHWAAVSEREEFVATCEAAIVDAAWNFADRKPRLVRTRS